MRVLVLESGGVAPDVRHQALSTVLDGGNGLPYNLQSAAQRCLGGSTVNWGGLCPRLSAADLRTRTSFGYGIDWPIAYQDVARYYCAAESWLRVGVDDHEREIPTCERRFDSPFARSARMLIDRLNSLGIERVHATRACADDRGAYAPLRLGRTVAPMMQTRSNVTILTDATVRRILVRKRGAVDGIVFRTSDGIERFARANVVVLCAGGVQNARLLLLSANASYPQGIGNDTGHVGRWFMEHPHRRFWLRLSRSIPPSELIGVDIPHWYDVRKQEGYGSLWVRVWLFDKPPAWARTDQAARANVLVDCLCEQEPDFQNVVGLDKEHADRLGDWLPTLRYRLGAREQSALAAMPNTVAPILDDLGRVVGEERLAFGAHLMGTTRMSRRPEDGVVDGNLKVHGMKNLYIAGASVFCTGGGVNPTLTLTALALRLADYLREHRRQLPA